jgi:hypothetical protein
MTTDTTEKGMEALIVRAMTGRTDVLVPTHAATEASVPVADGSGWLLGDGVVPPARGCRCARRWSPLPDPALRRQRQKQLDRLVGPPADRLVA